MLGDLAARKKYTVNLFTRKPEIWSGEIEVIDQENNTVIKSKIDKITDSPSILKEADVILSTLPSNVFTNVINELEQYICIFAKTRISGRYAGTACRIKVE